MLHLSTHLEIPIISVAIQYLYRDSDKPIAYISFQDPLPHHCSTLDIEASIKRGLTDIDSFHIGKNKDNFKPLFKRGLENKRSLISQAVSYFAEWKLKS